MSGAKCMYVLAVATGLGLLVIWQSTLVRSTGYQVADLEEAVRKEVSRKHKYKAQITKLKSPKRIFRLMKQLGIPLVSGTPRQKSEPTEKAQPEDTTPEPTPGAQPEIKNEEPSMDRAPLFFPSTTARSIAGDKPGSEGAKTQDSSGNRE